MKWYPILANLSRILYKEEVITMDYYILEWVKNGVKHGEAFSSLDSAQVAAIILWTIKDIPCKIFDKDKLLCAPYGDQKEDHMPKTESNEVIPGMRCKISTVIEVPFNKGDIGPTKFLTVYEVEGAPDRCFAYYTQGPAMDAGELLARDRMTKVVIYQAVPVAIYEPGDELPGGKMTSMKSLP
jgi:hypothetical protein